MGRSAMLNEPSFLVCAETSRLVASERALTSAPAMTAPLLSDTVPFIEPSVCWPEASRLNKIRLKRLPNRARKAFKGNIDTAARDRRTGRPSWNEPRVITNQVGDLQGKST